MTIVAASSPLISIIIPAYNAERFIDETLQSIQAQTYTNWEAIVVDDHSSDRTADLVRAYASRDSRIRFHLAPRHGGRPSISRNIGITLAQGEYITFMDSDDVYYPNGLQVLLEPLLKNLDLNASMAFPYYCDSELKPLHPSPHLVEREDGNFELAPDYQLSWEAICRSEVTLSVCCLMLRRSTLITLGPMDETLLMGEDFNYVINLLRMGWERLLVLPESTFKYRQYRGSVTKKPEHLISAVSCHVKSTNWLFSLPDLPETLKPLKMRYLYKRLSIIASCLTKLKRPDLAMTVIINSFHYAPLSGSVNWVAFMGKEAIRLILPEALQDFCSMLLKTNKVDYYKAYKR